MSEFDELSQDQLEALLDGREVPAPEPADEAVTPPAPEPPPPAPEPPAEEPVVDWRAKAEELEARAKHWERIAGKNGGALDFWKKTAEKLRAAGAGSSSVTPPDESVDYGLDGATPDYDFDRDERLARIEQELEERKAADEARLRDERVASEAARARPLFAHLDAETVRLAAAGLVDEWQAAMDEADPQIARDRTRAVASAIAARANEIKAQRQLGLISNRREARQFDRVSAIRRASTSSPGQASTRDLRPRSLDDLSTAEIEALLNEQKWDGRGF